MVVYLCPFTYFSNYMLCTKTGVFNLLKAKRMEITPYIIFSPSEIQLEFVAQGN